jgi:hypothetical protein
MLYRKSEDDEQIGENCDGCSVMYSRGMRGREKFAVGSSEFVENENDKGGVMRIENSEYSME